MKILYIICVDIIPTRAISSNSAAILDFSSLFISLTTFWFSNNPDFFSDSSEQYSLTKLSYYLKVLYV